MRISLVARSGYVAASMSARTPPSPTPNTPASADPTASRTAIASCIQPSRVGRDPPTTRSLRRALCGLRPRRVHSYPPTQTLAGDPQTFPVTALALRVVVVHELGRRLVVLGGVPGGGPKLLDAVSRSGHLLEVTVQ